VGAVTVCSKNPTAFVMALSKAGADLALAGAASPMNKTMTSKTESNFFFTCVSPLPLIKIYEIFPMCVAFSGLY